MNISDFQKRYKFDPNSDRLGEGGFGQVYKALDTRRDIYVAIKRAEKRSDGFTLEREFNLVNDLPRHPNVLRFLDYHSFDLGIAGHPEFLVMEYYEQGNLQSFAQNYTLKDAEKRRLIKGVLRGLSFLHQRGIIHRDLKPGNILVAREHGVYLPKLADFGLGKDGADIERSSLSNSAIGLTIAYAAPEQLLGEPIRPNIDLWAFGVLLYKIETGKLPFDSDKGETTAREAEIRRRVANADIPEDITQIAEPYQSLIRRCLVRDRKKRAQTAEELVELLLNSLKEERNEGALSEKTAELSNEKAPKVEKHPAKERAELETKVQSAENGKEEQKEVVAKTELYPPKKEEGNKTNIHKEAKEEEKEREQLKIELHEKIARERAKKAAQKKKAPPAEVKKEQPPQKKLTGKTGSVKKAPPKKKGRSLRWLGIAAIFLLVATAAVWLMNKRGNQGWLAQSSDDVGSDASALRIETAPQELLQEIESHLVTVKGGDFTMGASNFDNGNPEPDEYPQHVRRINDFEISKYEVTQALWEDVTGADPSTTRNCPQCPVETISYNDIQAFIARLNEVQKKQGSTADFYYTLPTEAEWEYAARGGRYAGNRTTYAGSEALSQVGWVKSNAKMQTHPVGEKQPNALGLYDMTGNVWEWCADAYDENAYSKGYSPTRGAKYVLRGGSFVNDPSDARLTNRYADKPDERLYSRGFRLVRKRK